MTDEKTLQILLQVKSDITDLQRITAELKGTKTALDETARSGLGLSEAFTFGAANEAVRELTAYLKQVPEALFEVFRSGVAFNAEMQLTQVAIAGLFRQEDPDQFNTFAKAMEAAAVTTDLLKEKANQLGAAYSDMFEGFQHAQPLLNNAGVSNVRQQIDTFALLTRAMESVTNSASQAARDTSDLLQGSSGRGAQTAGVRGLAGMVRMSTEELLQWIDAAKQSGDFTDQIQAKFAGLADSMSAFAQTLDGQTNRMNNAIRDLKQDLAGPIMEPLTEGIEAFTKAAGSTEAQAAARTLGDLILNLVTAVEAAAFGFRSMGVEISALEKTIGNSSFLLGLLDALKAGGKAALNLVPGAGLAVSAGQAVGENIGETYQTEKQITEEKKKQNAEVELKKKAQQESVDQLKLEKEIQDQLNLSLARASGDTEAIAEQQANTAADKVVATMKEKHVTQLQINGAMLDETQVWKTIFDATYQQATALTAQKTAHQDILALLRAGETVIQGIRQDQQLLATQPFLSADARQSALLNLSLKEQVAIQQEILKLQIAIKQINAIGDPKQQAQVEEFTQKLHQLQFQYVSLSQKIPTLSFTGGLKKSLADWVTGFGNSAQQIGNLIEGSINTSLQATNELLLDAAFRTGDWRQTLMGAERQILNLFLTWIEQMALQKAAQLLGITTTTSAQVGSGAAIAAAHAPAAAATSVSSYGAAAIVGEVLAVAAIAAIIAAITGGFKKGGYTGSGDPNEIAGPAHKNEYIFTSDEVNALGVPFLQNLAAGAGGTAKFPAALHLARGGRVSEPGVSPGSFEVEPGMLPGTGHYYPGPQSGPPSVEITPGASSTPPNHPPNAPGMPAYPADPTFLTADGSIRRGPGTDIQIFPRLGGGYGPMPGEVWLPGGGTATGTDPNTGKPVYQPLGYGNTADLGAMWSSFVMQAFFSGFGMGFGGGSANANSAHPMMRFATGAVVPGSPSRVDTVMAMLATGERVIDSDTEATIASRWGMRWPEMLKAYAVSSPTLHLAAGGVVGTAVSSSTTRSARRERPVINVHIYDDKKKWTREMMRSNEFEDHFIDLANRTRPR